MFKNQKIHYMHFLLLTFIYSFSLLAMDQSTPFTRLMCATYHNNTAEVATLLRNNTQFRECDTQWGKDPLGWAAHHGNATVVSLLLRKGFLIKTCPIDGSNVLHTAAYHNRVFAMRQLLTYPHCKYTPGDTVALLKQRHMALLRHLLSQRTTLAGLRMTPYEAACELQDSGCRDLLDPQRLEQNIDAQITTNYEQVIRLCTLEDFDENLDTQ